MRRSLWLCLFLLWAGVAQARDALVLQGLAVDATAAQVLSGDLDDRLAEPETRPVIQQRGQRVRWWRVSVPRAVAAEDDPKLLLRSPFLYRVEAWAPGAAGPVRHALYGGDADFRYSHRALVVDLPAGIPQGGAVWLRVEAGSSVAMPLSIEPLDKVHRDDLAYVAWRAFILSVLLVLVLLAVAFWSGTGERSYGYFGAMLCFAVLYLVSISGDLRALPGADVLFGATPQTNRVFGGLGVVFSNLFQRAYLDLPGKLPRLDRALWAGTVLAAVAGIGSVFVDTTLLAACGNLGLVLSAFLLLGGSAILAWRGDRPGRVVMVSWLPLIVCTTLVATEMMGLWIGPTWLGQGLAGSFALAGLLLTIGLADKLLQLRRDFDQAHAMARADELTGAYNRPGIEQELHREMERAATRGSPLSIAFIDLDHFKRINDRHGHGIGDQCLRIVSQRLKNQLRDRDILGRYGGDEFLVVLPDTRLADALVIAGRMRGSVNCRPLTMDDMQLHGTLSIGVAELAAGETTEALFGRADAALYASKAAGRDRVTGASDSPEEAVPA